MEFYRQDNSILKRSHLMYLIPRDLCVILNVDGREFRIIEMTQYDTPDVSVKIDLLDRRGLSVCKEYLTWESDVNVKIFKLIEDDND